LCGADRLKVRNESTRKLTSVLTKASAGEVATWTGKWIEMDLKAARCVLYVPGVLVDG
jgi:hypothetical protein